MSVSSDYIQPLANWVAQRKAQAGTVVVGINGAQGSGKSTLALALQSALAEHHGLTAAILSLDDLYLTRAQREALAREQHPLFITRGVPGTHDVGMGLQLLQALKNLRAGESLALPRFIKAGDDRAPASSWTRVQGPVHVILFEGWCVGTPAQAPAELRTPVNALEAEEDADGTWRQQVNAQLAGDYARLFAQLDVLLYLKIPDFDCIYAWRLQQEADNLRQAGAGTSQAMAPEALRRFIQHYERLTRHAMRILPTRADRVAVLGLDHEIQALLP